MKKQLSILLAGIFIFAPFAITVGIIWWAGSTLDGIFGDPIRVYWPSMPAGFGILMAVVLIYLIGLTAHFWLFRGILSAMEALMVRLPGVKLLYESVRDLMSLFHREGGPIGKAVSCKLPGMNGEVLGILTNENPEGFSQPDGPPKVAVYLPLSYMIGGITIYLSADSVKEVDMTVDQALKVSTMAQVTNSSNGSENPRANGT